MLDTENKFVSTGLAKEIADAALGKCAAALTFISADSSRFLTR